MDYSYNSWSQLWQQTRQRGRLAGLRDRQGVGEGRGGEEEGKMRERGREWGKIREREGGLEIMGREGGRKWRVR